jgi:hypothetical protein
VEEKVIAQELFPFPKTNASDPTIYAVKLFTGAHVRFNDGTQIRDGWCCDEKTPKYVDAEQTSIKRYHHPGYLGWFSIRFGSTWYEIHAPKDTVASEYEFQTKVPLR